MNNSLKKLIGNNSFKIFTLKSKWVFAEIIFLLPKWIDEVNESFLSDWEEAKDSNISFAPESQITRLKKKFICWLDENSNRIFIGSDEIEASEYLNTSEDKMTQLSNFFYETFKKYGWIQIVDYLEYEAISLTNSGMNAITQLEELNKSVQTSYQSQWTNIKNAFNEVQDSFSYNFNELLPIPSFTILENLKNFILQFKSNLKSIHIRLLDRVSEMIRTSFFNEEKNKEEIKDEIDRWIDEVQDFIDSWFNPAFYNLMRDCSKDEILKIYKTLKDLFSSVFFFKTNENVIEWNELAYLLAEELRIKNALADMIDIENAFEIINEWKNEIVTGLLEAANLLENITRVCMLYQRLTIQKINFLLSNGVYSKEEKMKNILNLWIKNGLSLDLSYEYFRPISHTNLTYPRKRLDNFSIVMNKHTPQMITEELINKLQHEFEIIKKNERELTIDFLNKNLKEKMQIRASELNFECLEDTIFYLSAFMLEASGNCPFKIEPLFSSNGFSKVIDGFTITFSNDYDIRRI